MTPRGSGYHLSFDKQGTLSHGEWLGDERLSGDLSAA